MEEALGFFRAFEVWIYLLLGLGALFYIRRFIVAWQELRGSGFGLERESARARLNQSASVLVLLLILATAEFVLVSFIAPAVPGASPLPTATLDLLATPTTTLAAITPAAGTETVPFPAETEVSGLFGEGCIPGQVEITQPQPGQEISGIVVITGTANIPNFGFYKYEMKRPDDTIWATIQAGNEPKQEGQLGNWDTRRLPPGEYDLGLVVADNQGKAQAPCIVRVRVAKPAETPSP